MQSMKYKPLRKLLPTQFLTSFSFSQLLLRLCCSSSLLLQRSILLLSDHHQDHLDSEAPSKALALPLWIAVIAVRTLPIPLPSCLPLVMKTTEQNETHLKSQLRFTCSSICREMVIISENNRAFALLFHNVILRQ